MSLKKYIPKSEFSRNVLTLMTGTTIAQAIPVAISPILSRLYTPDDFGVFGLYFGISMILSVLVTARFEIAILLPAKDEDAINVMALSLVISGFITLLLFLLVFFLSDWFAMLLNDDTIKPWLYWIPLSTLLIGVYQSFNYWITRKKYYKRLVWSRVSRSANTSAFSMAGGLIPLQPGGGLIIADIIGQGFAAGVLGKGIYQKDRDWLKFITTARIKQMAKRYINFPKFQVISGLLERLAGQSPVLLLTSFFNFTVSGYFSFSQRMVMAPANLVSGAIGDVFRQEASSRFASEGSCQAIFLSTLKKLVLLSVVPFVILFFIVPDMFAFIFGAEWRTAGEYAQIMMIMFLLQFIVSPLSGIFMIAEKQQYDLLMQIGLFIGCVSAFFIGHTYFKDPKVSILLFTIVYSIKSSIELLLAYRFSQGK